MANGADRQARDWRSRIGAAVVGLARRLADGAERGGDGSGDSGEAEVQTKL